VRVRQTAIFGYSFCTAAKKAFFLILRNILRIAAVSMVGDFVLLLGKVGLLSHPISFHRPMSPCLSLVFLLAQLLIPAATTFAAYIVIQLTVGDDISGILAPLIVTAILSYFTANMFNEVSAPAAPRPSLLSPRLPSVYDSLFLLFLFFRFQVYGMAISTILQCFLADEELFPDKNDRYADGSLADTIDKINVQAKSSVRGLPAACQPAPASPLTARVCVCACVCATEQGGT
jgi:hypothetical protein